MAKNPPVVQAASLGNLADVEDQLCSGCDVNQRGIAGLTALISAAQSGHTDFVGALLKAGADVNAYDVNSQTSLILASMRGHAECVRILLEAGAYKDACNAWGNTALTVAASQNNRECVELLLDARATVSIANKHKKDALAMAKQMKHREIEALLSRALDTQRLVLTLHVDLVHPDGESVDVRLTDMAGSEQASCTAPLVGIFSITRAQLGKELGTDNYQLLLPSGRVLSSEDDMQLLSAFVDSDQPAQVDSCL